MIAHDHLFKWSFLCLTNIGPLVVSGKSMNPMDLKYGQGSSGSFKSLKHFTNSDILTHLFPNRLLPNPQPYLLQHTISTPLPGCHEKYHALGAADAFTISRWTLEWYLWTILWCKLYVDKTTWQHSLKRNLTSFIYALQCSCFFHAWPYSERTTSYAPVIQTARLLPRNFYTHMYKSMYICMHSILHTKGYHRLVKLVHYAINVGWFPNTQRAHVSISLFDRSRGTLMALREVARHSGGNLWGLQQSVLHLWVGVSMTMLERMMSWWAKFLVISQSWSSSSQPKVTFPTCLVKELEYFVHIMHQHHCAIYSSSIKVNQEFAESWLWGSPTEGHEFWNWK